MAALNYHHLRLFQAIAREGGLTRAAERVNVSPSALSTQLQKLERQLGHTLFERQGRRLILTEAGRIALDYSDAVFQAGDELVSTLAGRPAARRQVLKIGALTTLSRNFQLQFLRPLVGRTDVELIVRSGTLRELLAQIEAHSLDLLLANRPVPRDAGIAWQNYLIDEQPVSLIGHPSDQPFRFPDDLRNTPMLLPGRDSDIRLAFDQMMEIAGVRPAVLAEVDDMAMLRLLARESAGVALAPPVVVQDELKSGLLVERCRVPEIKASFYAIVQARRFPNPLVSGLLVAQDRAVRLPRKT